MSGVVRFGVSTDEKLLEHFDSLIVEKGYVNRSEAIRDLIRNALVEQHLETGEEEAVGSVILLYDHHFSDLSDKLTEYQHSHLETILMSLHFHLDNHHCLEVIMLRGITKDIQRLANELISTKGVKHGKFVATATGSGVI